MSKRFFTSMWCLLTAFALAGCASTRPLPRTMIRSWPYGEYEQMARRGAALDVEVCLKAADQYRERYREMMVSQPAFAHWYGEESKKFYNHILNELEPQNAYAAVSLGYLALVQARHTDSRKDREMALDSAYAKLMQADRNRKGYADAHVYLGELYVLRKEWDRAIREFSLLATSGIEDSNIHAWWGYALSKQGSALEAREHFRKAVELGYPEEAASWARQAVSSGG
jgi:tetratricopeptide (TPR) repeat protein